MYSRAPGAWLFLSRWSRETSGTSQTENWHVVSPLVSEFWSAMSSLLIVAVGLRRASPVATAAGALSFASHAIPYRAVHWLDFVGIAMVALRVAANPHVWADHGVVVAAAAAALAFLVDRHLRPQGDPLGTQAHVIWHVAAANALDCLERAL